MKAASGEKDSNSMPEVDTNSTMRLTFDRQDKSPPSGAIVVIEPEDSNDEGEVIIRDLDETLCEEVEKLILDNKADDLRKFLESNAEKSKNTVRALLSRLDEDEMGALHYAARYSDQNILQLLVEYGSDVNQKGKDGYSPLHFIARYCMKRKQSSEESQAPSEIASPSIDADVRKNSVSSDVSALEVEESQPLLSSPSHSRDQVEMKINYLLMLGADPNETCRYGMTPLHHAAMKGNLEALRVFLKNEGINIEAKDSRKMTPLQIAVKHGKVECTQELLKSKAEVMHPNSSGTTLLHSAAEIGNHEIMEMLISKDPNMVNIEDSDKWTPLHKAVANGHFEATNVLIEKCSNPIENNIADVFRKSTASKKQPLHYAAQVGDCRIILLLLQKKLNTLIDCRDKENCTPLHYAAMNNHVDALKMLLEWNARIDATTKDSMTALLFAAKHGATDCMRELMTRHASLTITDSQERNLMHWVAVSNPSESLKTLLLDSSTWKRQVCNLMNILDRNGNSPLHVAAIHGHEEMIRWFIRAEASAKIQNNSGDIALHIAARHENGDIIKLLTKNSYGLVDSVNDEGETALHVAASKGNMYAMEVLLNNCSATVDMKNNQSRTPLSFAAEKGHEKCLKMLIDCNSSVSTKDNIGWTPLHFAAKGGHVSAIKILLEKGASLIDYNSTSEEHVITPLEVAMKYHKIGALLEMAKSKEIIEALRLRKRNKKGQKTTLMREMIRKFPDVTKDILDRMIDKLGDVSNQINVRITADLLDDSFVGATPDSYAYNLETGKVEDGARLYTKNRGKIKEQHPLALIAKHQPRNLTHPVVVTILNYKWSRFPRFFYYTNVCLFLLFLSTCTAFVILAIQLERLVSQEMPKFSNLLTNESIPFSDRCNSMMNSTNFTDKTKVSYRWLTYGMDVCKWLTIVMSCVFLVRETVQLVIGRSLSAAVQYLQSSVNLVELYCYIGSILLVCDFDYNYCRREWQWSVGAVAIFFDWMALILLIRKLPLFGIYVIMVTDVLKTFLSFSSIFLLFIVAFGLSFMIIFRSHYRFEGELQSLLTTTVMMIADMGYYDLFANPEEPLQFPVASYILYVLFLVIMSVIVMNLLVGLAVDDIRSVLEKAELNKLILKTQLVLELDSVMPDFLLKHYARSFIDKKEDAEDTVMKKILNMVGYYVPGYFKVEDNVVKSSNNVEESLESLSVSVKQLVRMQEQLKNQIATMSLRNTFKQRMRTKY